MMVGPLAYAAKGILNGNVRNSGCVSGPGTIHACKCLFPEEVHLSVGSVADPPIFRNSFPCESSDLLGQERPGLEHRLGIGQHIP
jgi:hypothetical protein